MRGAIFNQVKKLIPKISETELIALRSGTTSIDRMLFEGKVQYRTFQKQNDEIFDKNKINELLKKFPDQHIFPNSDYKSLLDHMGKQGFFSFLIPK